METSNLSVRAIAWKRRSLLLLLLSMLLLFVLPGCGAGGEGGDDPYEVPEAELALTGMTPDSVIRPAEGAPDVTVSVTLTGRGFRKAGARVLVGGPGVSVAGFEVDSDNRIIARITVSANATFGAHDLGVATDDLTSNSLALRVVSASTPTLTGLSPESGQRGTEVPVAITGTNFAAGEMAVEAGGRIAVSNVQVASPTRLTATFVIPPGESLGDHAVRVTRNGESAANSLRFSVTLGNPPALTGIAPGSGARGGAVPVVLTGTGFVDGAEIDAPGGITASAARVINPTQIIATLTIDPGAALGAHEVKVRQFGTISNAVAFTVTPGSAGGGGAPVITSVSPESGTQGGTVSLTITGENFAAGARLNLTGINPGIDPAAVQVVSPTRIDATFTLPLDAVPGPQEIVVVQGVTTSNAAPFTIVRATFDTRPTLTRVSPNEIGPGAHAVTLTGTNFTALATVQVTGGGAVTVSDVAYVSPTELRATFTVAGASGRRDVTVTTGAGVSNPVPIFLFQ